MDSHLKRSTLQRLSLHVSDLQCFVEFQKGSGLEGDRCFANTGKRHILVDILGLLLVVTVTAANVSDREGLMQLLTTYFGDGVKRLRKLWVDAGYRGTSIFRWVRALEKTHKIGLEVAGRIGPGFQVIAKRWVVERTFGWLNLRRRLSKDYEVLTRNSEAMIQVAFITVLIRRLV